MTAPVCCPGYRRLLLAGLVVVALALLAARLWLTPGAQAQDKGEADKRQKEQEVADLLATCKGEVDLYLDTHATFDGVPGSPGFLSRVKVVGVKELLGKRFLVVEQANQEKAQILRSVLPGALSAAMKERLSELKDRQWLIDPAHIVAISIPAEK